MRDWSSAPLGALASFQKGRKVEVSDHPRPGFAPYLGASALDGGEATQFASTNGAVLSTKNDVLMLWDGERSGLVGKGKAGVVSSTVAKLTPRPGIVSDLLYYLLDFQFDWIQGRRTGTGVPHVPRDLSRILKLRYPLEFTHQQRITEILSTIDEAIEHTEALIAKMQQINVGLIHDLFTRGIAADGRLRPPREEAPELYKESPLGWIPATWHAGHIGKYAIQVGGLKPGPFGSSITKADYVENGYRVYGQEQVLAGSLCVGDYYIGQAKWLELSDFAVADGDVLMTLVGVGTIGKVLVVEEPFEPGVINPRLMRIRPDRAKCHATFLAHLIASSFVRRQFNRFATGGTMPVLNASIVRRVHVPIVPLHEQRLLSERIQSLEEMQLVVRVDLVKLKHLRSGLMRELLASHMISPSASHARDLGAANV